MPLGISGEREVARQHRGRGAPDVIAGKLGKGDDVAFCRVVDAALDTGQLRGALAPGEGFLYAIYYCPLNHKWVSPTS